MAGPLQTAGAATGMVLDFDELSAIVRPRVVDRLDHASLNDAMPNPTAEHIALWIWNELTGAIPGLVEIVVWETPTARAVVRAEDARAR